MKLRGIEIQNTEPNSDVLWAKPVAGGGFAFYLFNNGRWQPMVIMNDQGTSTFSDDTVADLANVDDIVRDEVTRQMGEYDKSVGDTHNTGSGDDTEYPSVDNLFPGE